VNIPKDAAAVILLRQTTDPANPEVFWVQRSQKLAFLGGFHSFAGGQMDAEDGNVEVTEAADSQTAAMINCAARELFEELGILATRGSELLTQGQRESLLDDLESGRMSWPGLLAHYDLHLNAQDFTYVGRWVTPPMSPRRFDTWFFIVRCPPRQIPVVKADGELAIGEWIRAKEACDRWNRSEVLLTPPTLHALRTLAGGLTADLVDRFLSVPQANRAQVRRIEFCPNFICFPVLTPTKPPATHTNSYLIYSSREILVVDPASPYPEEQQELLSCVSDLVNGGRSVREIILTHLHADHVGGVNALRASLGNVKVAAHQFTAQPLANEIVVDRLIGDNDNIKLAGDPPITLRAMHTPGHARGHLCLYESRTGTLLTGDNIVGVGSVLIDPPEGNMSVYLDSLRRIRGLPNLTVLLGGHGPAMANPYKKIDEYINHRLEREKQILQAVRDGATTPKEIVAIVYSDTPPKAHGMAERAVVAHLEKLIAEGHVQQANLR